MKTKKYILKSLLGVAALASAGMMLTSCEDMLDTKPQGSFSEEQIGDNEANELMTSAYATLMCHYFGNNESFAGPINNWIFDVRSDDAQKGGDAISMEGNIHQLEIGNIQSDNVSILYKWQNNFFSIARCNTAIRAIQSSGKLSDSEKKSMVAEMKTLRGYYYFDLYRIFKKFPYITEEDSDPSSVAPAENKEAVIADVMEDLKDACEILPETQPQVARINRYVAASILCKVATQVADWQTVEKYADMIINSGRYSLYPNIGDMSKTMYNDQYETLFAVHFSSANERSQYNYCNCLNFTYNYKNSDKIECVYPNTIGDDFYLASQNLVNAFRTDANGLPMPDSFNSENVMSVDYAGTVDPRLDYTIGRVGGLWRGEDYTINWVRNPVLYSGYSGKKPYPGPDDPGIEFGCVPWCASSLNCNLIRYADVILMKAEALIEQNKNLPEARALINQIRNRAKQSIDFSYAPADLNFSANYKVEPYSEAQLNDQASARKALRMERRLELAMEGHRWFDLVRWGEAVDVMNAYYASEKLLRPYYEGAILLEKDLYFPIPLKQVQDSNGLYD